MGDLSAQGPLFAFRTDREQGFAVFDWVAVLGQDANNFPGDIRLNLIHQLHGFDNAKYLAALDAGANPDKRIRVRRWRSVKRTDNRGLDEVELFLRRFRCTGRRTGDNCRNGAPAGSHWRARWGSRQLFFKADADAAALVLEFRESVLVHERQHALDLGEVHPASVHAGAGDWFRFLRHSEFEKIPGRRGQIHRPARRNYYVVFDPDPAQALDVDPRLDGDNHAFLKN